MNANANPAAPASDPNTVQRVFEMEGMELTDIAPDLEPPIRSLRLYAAQYPHLKRATLSEPRVEHSVEGTRFVYTVEMPPAKIKG